MKTHKNLYPKICTFENLLLAAQKAQKGKRFQENVAAFNFSKRAGSRYEGAFGSFYVSSIFLNL